MHSRVFIIITDPNCDIFDFYNSEDGAIIAQEIDADYVCLEELYEMENSVEWLKQAYNLKQVEKIIHDDDGIEIDIYKINTKELLDEFQKEKEKRIALAKECLDKGDLSGTAYWAYNAKEFFFYIDDNGPYNFIDILDHYKDLPENLYIIQTFDYHF